MATQLLNHAAGVRLTLTDCTLDLAWYGPDIIRCRAWVEREPPLASPFLSASPEAPEGWTLSEQDRAVTLRSAALVVCVDTATGLVRYETTDGHPLLAEAARAFPARNYPRPEDRRGARVAFAVDDDAPIIGGGQLRDGRVDRRHTHNRLAQTNFEAVLPVACSPARWALLWHNASYTTFGHTDGRMTWESNIADGVDYFVGHAEGERLVALYHRLTGRPPLPPRWALGYFQSKERYHTADEVLAVVREFRRRGLPLDCIVQDWAYWGQWGETHKWSCMRYDEAVYGDLPGLLRTLHDDLHTRLMISIWPSIGVGSDLEQELTALGATFDPEPGHWQGDGMVKVYDSSNPDARTVYWRHAWEGLGRHGIDAWWMDATEPELVNSFAVDDMKAAADTRPDLAAGSWARNLNGYVTPHVHGVYRGQRAATPDKRIFILTRAGFLGTQAAGAAVWSGDISATWRCFAEQIGAGISMTASGIPWWTTDCGAFFTGPAAGGHFAGTPEAAEDPAYRELYLRWFQFETFSPLMRSHGTQTPREPWRFGEPGTPFYDGLVDMLALRYRLLPYLEAEAARLSAEGGTLMRPLALAFPGDARAAAVADQYLFGPALMPCPVTRPLRYPPADTAELVDYDLVTHTQGRHGFTLCRYADASWTDPLSESHTPHIDLRWDARAALATARFTAREDGAHTFIVRVAGGARLLLDGQAIAEDWTVGDEREVCATVNLRAGEPHDLRLEYRNDDRHGRLKLALAEPSRPRQQWTCPAEETRDAYLPAGTWYDFWTGTLLKGGRTVAMPAPLARLPLLVRAGSILPLGPHRQWVDQTPCDPTELRIYLGADGAFTLYDDAGDGYDYEQGACARIPLRWDDAARTLTIGAREGAFPGMLEARTFDIVLVGQDYGGGIDPARADRTVIYTGQPQEISL